MARKKIAASEPKTGRPGKYDPKTVKDITDAIGAGLTIAEACVYGDISEATYYEWQATKPEFSESIQKAQVKAKMRRILRIEQAGREGNWQADAWYLERKYPEEFGRKLTLQISPEHAALLQMAGLTISDAWKKLMEWLAQELYNNEHEGEIGDGTTIDISAQS